MKTQNTNQRARLVGRRVGPRVFGPKAKPLTPEQQSNAAQRHALVTQLINEHPELNRLSLGCWPNIYLKQVRALI